MSETPKLCTTDGRPVADARASQTNETGQHPSYIVLCPDERAKGSVEPYRDAYRHVTCGTVTTMGRALSETYARDPSFYSHTFCVHCNRHLPVEFAWTADGRQVGSRGDTHAAVTPPAAAGERLEALARETAIRVVGAVSPTRLDVDAAEAIILAALRRVGGGQ